MKNTKEKMKWLYTFYLFTITMLWAAFLVWFVWNASAAPQPVDMLAASGVGVLLGALLSWNANVNKHWFGGEKKPPEES